VKTVRFSNVVAKGGKPEPYTLWTDPKKDPEFKRAIKENRVLSVHQETVGSKADYGTVGFKGDRHAQLLVFPKSIRSFDGKRVVGVKYDLVDQPEEAPNPKKSVVHTAKAVKPKTKHSQPKAVREPVAKKQKPKRERKAAKIIHFPKSHQPAKPVQSVTKFRTELHRAIKALEAGKAVQAHQILKELDEQMADANKVE
jgi:hypothetical protein